MKLIMENWRGFVNEQESSGDEIIEAADGKIVIFAQWSKNHIEDGHKEPGKGSVYADFALGLVNKVLQQVSPDPSKAVYEVEVPNVGYNLVIPNDEASRLPNAKQTEVEKEDRNGPIKVNAFMTSAPMSSFLTNKMSIVIRPTDQIKFVPESLSQDERISAAIERGELYSVISSWPGRGDVPPASQWGDDWAVIIPDQN